MASAGADEDAREAAETYASTTNDRGWRHTIDALTHLSHGRLHAAEDALISSGVEWPLSRAAMVRVKRAQGQHAEAAFFEQAVLQDLESDILTMGYALARMYVIDAASTAAGSN